MPRRKEPRIPDTVLDQLLSGADPKTAFDPNRSAMTTASCFQRGPRCQGGRPSGANRSATISGRVRSSASQKGAGAGLHALATGGGWIRTVGPAHKVRRSLSGKGELRRLRTSWLALDSVPGGIRSHCALMRSSTGTWLRANHCCPLTLR